MIYISLKKKTLHKKLQGKHSFKNSFFLSVMKWINWICIPCKKFQNPIPCVGSGMSVVPVELVHGETNLNDGSKANKRNQ
jgi:hypothetical protein